MLVPCLFACLSPLAWHVSGAPLSSRELDNRVVAVSKARPELLRVALSPLTSPSLLRLALTKAHPDILELALTRAQPQLLQVALRQATPQNLKVALTYSDSDAFQILQELPASEDSFPVNSFSPIEADILQTDDDNDIFEEENEDIVVVGEDDDLIVNEDGSVIFQGQEFSPEEVDQAVSDLLVALLIESILSGGNNQTEEAVGDITKVETKQSQIDPVVIEELIEPNGEDSSEESSQESSEETSEETSGESSEESSEESQEETIQEVQETETKKAKNELSKESPTLTSQPSPFFLSYPYKLYQVQPSTFVESISPLYSPQQYQGLYYPVTQLYHV